MGMDDKEIAQMNYEPFFYKAVFCNAYAMAIHRGGGDANPPKMFDGFSFGGEICPETGFAMPYFTKEVMIKETHCFARSSLIYDDKQDAFVFKDKLGELPVISVYKGEDIEVVDLETGDTSIVHAYPVGRGPGWPWMEFLKTWKVETRYVCPYCGAEAEHGTDAKTVLGSCDFCGHKVNI